MPIATGPRAALEAFIEELIATLDNIDPDPDLEPSLGAHGRYAVDAEGDDCDLESTGDDEPSLGSFDRMVDQTKSYRQSAGYHGGEDRELDRSDYEDGGDDEDGHDAEEQSWSNPLGAKVGINGRLGWGLIEERVPDRQVRS